MIISEKRDMNPVLFMSGILHTYRSSLHMNMTAQYNAFICSDTCGAVIIKVLGALQHSVSS